MTGGAPLRADTGNAMISYQVSETMKVAVKVAGDELRLRAPRAAQSVAGPAHRASGPRTQIQEFGTARLGSLLPTVPYV